MIHGDHNFIEITQQTSCESLSSCRASRARRVERVELCCSTMSTLPKCMGTARRTCRVVSSRAKWNLGFSGVIEVKSCEIFRAQFSGLKLIFYDFSNFSHIAAFGTVIHEIAYYVIKRIFE